MNRPIALAILAALLLAGGAGYMIGRLRTAPQGHAVPAPPEARRILYYRNPMAPEDRSPAPKKDSMGMDFIPVYADEPEIGGGAVAIDPARLQLLGVRTAPAETRTLLTRTLRATATVQPDERRLAAVTAKAEGWVEKLAVIVGAKVRRGQILAWIYSPEMVAAEQEYLVAAGLGAGHHQGAMGGDADMLLRASAQRLRALDIGDEEIARLRREGAPARLFAVRAPEGGIVTERPAAIGMRFAAGEPLLRTADLSTVWLTAELAEADLALARPGQAVAAGFVAHPGRRFAGRVEFVYPQLDARTRTGRIRIAMPNDDMALKLDMYGSVAIEVADAEAGGAITVPDSAVIDSGARQVVLVELGEGRFAPREVRLGMRGDGAVQILDGLAAGERVVVGANFLIDAESNLQAALQGFAGGKK
jgi:Cu(I)/Ag(I) efflux system membrane fusion protein